MDASKDSDLYRIGTVASLTGISVERLRAWERRYDLSPAQKSGKTRFYSKAQLERLKLIKHLIDQGQPISTLADLSYAQLMGRAETGGTVSNLAAARKPRVGLIGLNLLMLEQQAVMGGHSTQRMEVTSRWANFEAFEAEADSAESAQVILAQLPVLKREPVEIIQDIFPDADVVVVYQFATAKILGDLQSAGLPALKWPLSWAEIEHAVISEHGYAAQGAGVAPRRFSDEEMIALAATVDDPTSCTQYLVEAISQVNALGTYTGDSLHAAPRTQPYRNLLADISHARAQLEQALERLTDSLQAER